MKKVLIILVVFGLFMLLTSEKNLMWCKQLIGFMDNPQAIRRGEIFKQLSQNYYGSSSYWKELSLVNNSWDNRSDDELIIPSFKSISKLKQEQSLSASNEIYDSQDKQILQGIIHPEID